MTTIDEIFADDRSNPPAERSLPWEETHGTVTVVVEPKPHWASDMRAFRRTEQTYSIMPTGPRMVDARGSMGISTRPVTDVMMKARTMLTREIADGLWD